MERRVWVRPSNLGYVFHLLKAVTHVLISSVQVVKRFKNGEFNVLVATSIGEEGLDIGEIDRIVCYDTQKSSIRLVSEARSFLSMYLSCVF